MSNPDTDVSDEMKNSNKGNTGAGIARRVQYQRK
ncbi:hypothetical protein J2T59_002054 [Methanosalsum natronophilum]|nr:hypothetical protein [Methanosalsum natronophilum]